MKTSVFGAEKQCRLGEITNFKLATITSSNLRNAISKNLLLHFFQYT